MLGSTLSHSEQQHNSHSEDNNRSTFTDVFALHCEQKTAFFRFPLFLTQLEQQPTTIQAGTANI